LITPGFGFTFRNMNASHLLLKTGVVDGVLLKSAKISGKNSQLVEKMRAL